jgi:hypothetical protein
MLCCRTQGEKCMQHRLQLSENVILDQDHTHQNVAPPTNHAHQNVALAACHVLIMHGLAATC